MTTKTALLGKNLGSILGTGISTMRLYKKYSILKAFKYTYLSNYRYFKHFFKIYQRKLKLFFFRYYIQCADLLIQAFPHFSYINATFMRDVTFFNQFLSQSTFKYFTLTKSLLSNSFLCDFKKPFNLYTGYNYLLFTNNLKTDLIFDHEKLGLLLNGIFPGTMSLKGVSFNYREKIYIKNIRDDLNKSILHFLNEFYKLLILLLLINIYI